jgi:hypothetical protein
MREALEVGEQRVELVRIADGVAADEGCAGDDAIGEEGAVRRGEVVALVAPEGEEGEAVAPVRVDELADRTPFRDRLRNGPSAAKPSRSPTPSKQSPSRSGSSAPRSSIPSTTAPTAAPASPTTSSGRAASGSPGTSKRER